MNFLLWKNWVNIYIGKYGDHYAEDVKISSEKDVNNFIEQLKILLTSEIIEKNYLLAQNRKKYVYLFKFKSKFKKFKNLSLLKSDGSQIGVIFWSDYCPTLIIKFIASIMLMSYPYLRFLPNTREE